MFNFICGVRFQKIFLEKRIFGLCFEKKKALFRLVRWGVEEERDNWNIYFEVKKKFDLQKILICIKKCKFIWFG